MRGQEATHPILKETSALLLASFTKGDHFCTKEV